MVQRELYMKKIRRLIDKDIIKVITGVRRCGKSYMLGLIIEELIKSGIDKNNILLINFEDYHYSYIENSKQLDEIVIKFLEDKKDKTYLFFDEIQNITEWEKSINSYRLLNCDIYITGSNSKLLSTEFASILTGRTMEIKMYPFSYNEFLDYKMQDMKIDENLKNIYTTQLFDEYYQYGGIPFTLALDKKDKLTYLNDIFNAILYKDLLERYKIRDIDLLKRLIVYIIDNVGNPFSSNSISKFLKHEKINVSHLTIQNYLNYLENTCLIIKVPRYDITGKKILTVQEKYYLVDQGFIQAMNTNPHRNIGRILENIVYLELLRHDYNVTIGKNKDYEIDFICTKHNIKFYIQVTQYLTEDNYEREIRPLLKIKDNYPKYIISQDTYDVSSEGIIHINLIKFLKDFEKVIKS